MITDLIITKLIVTFDNRNIFTAIMGKKPQNGQFKSF